MAVNGYTGAFVVLSSCGKCLAAWENHCSILNSLANQLQTCERSETDGFEVPDETLPAVRTTIQEKMIDEVRALSAIVDDLERSRSQLSTLCCRMEIRCNKLLLSADTPSSSTKDDVAEAIISQDSAAEFRQLKTISGVATQLSLLIAMKKVPLQNSQMEDFQKLNKAFKDNAVATKDLEARLKEVTLLLKTL
ncbi:unnamed protein product [Meganyctiphanes norvegica]|uniref:Uncharacterized protein n=1 Tax=Meganyctiphanes norvegica TaxID=48144 RepID=A0AAV2Q549_MEGNR